MRHLKAFYVFHIAAESNGYSDAADKLHITHGAVSKQIKQLEEHLSQSLFYKKNRSMQLTAMGTTLKQYTDVAFSALDNGINKLKEEKDDYLEVSCEPTLTMRWLMPRLANFYQDTGIDVRLSTAGGSIKLSNSGLSMAIRRDDFDIPDDYNVEHIVEEWVGPVVSPSYWNSINGRLDKISLLHSNTRVQAWQNWSIEANQDLTSNKSQKYYDHFYFSIQAAVDGLGAAIGSYPLIADDIANGRLIAPFGFISSKHNYVILQTISAADSKQTAFKNWLISSMSKCVPL